MFCEFLTKLSLIYDRKFILFGDNATIHTANLTKTEAKKLGIKLIFNVPSEPDLNPIENYFSVFKTYYRKLRLHKCFSRSRPVLRK